MKDIDQDTWQAAENFNKTDIPETVYSWLFEDGSLTARVQDACGDNQFQLKVLEQSYAVPFLDEADKLGIQENDDALIREVYLMCEDVPWIYARSIIPKSTLTGEQQALAELGNNPLGAALFADPSMRRSKMEIRKSLTKDILPKAEALTNATIWGRRSVFYIQEKPLLVAEYFLPQLFCPCGAAILK